MTGDLSSMFEEFVPSSGDRARLSRERYDVLHTTIVVMERRDSPVLYEEVRHKYA